MGHPVSISCDSGSALLYHEKCSPFLVSPTGLLGGWCYPAGPVAVLWLVRMRDGHVFGQRGLPGESLGAHGTLVGQSASVILALVDLGCYSVVS